MKITLSNTTKIVEFNGVPARIWEGETESGIAVHAVIVRIAVHKDLDQTQFEAELEEATTPSPAVEMIPMRFVT